MCIYFEGFTILLIDKVNFFQVLVKIFFLSPSYNYWAPWIGPNTRKDTVLNTEYAPINAPRPATEDAKLGYRTEARRSA